MIIHAYQFTVDADVERTKALYKSYGERISHCQCANCAFYQFDFIHRNYGFFNMLKGMGVDPSRDNNAIYILDMDQYAQYNLNVNKRYKLRILGSYTISAVLEYNDDYYFPITKSGYRATEKIQEEHSDYLASINFVQSKADEITVDFCIDTKSFM